jgi:hypothetical protein
MSALGNGAMLGAVGALTGDIPSEVSAPLGDKLMVHPTMLADIGGAHLVDIAPEVQIGTVLFCVTCLRDK